MCHTSILEWFIENSEKKEFFGKDVLEIGGRDVNGGVRPIIEKFYKPRSYIGVDIQPGKSVDVLLPAERVLECFGVNSFDVIISTECLEHIQNWKLVVNNMKDVLKENGFMFVTAPSHGFHYHGYPYDYWRFSSEDMKEIFSDFDITCLETDKELKNTRIKARKPENHSHNDLRNVSLYSIVVGKRIQNVNVSMPLKRITLLGLRKIISTMVVVR